MLHLSGIARPRRPDLVWESQKKRKENGVSGLLKREKSDYSKLTGEMRQIQVLEQLWEVA